MAIRDARAVFEALTDPRTLYVFGVIVVRRSKVGMPGSLGAGGGGVARHVAEPGMPEQVVPVGMGGEPGDHRNAEPVYVIGELVQIGTIDAGIDQDQPTLPAHRDGIAPDPRALADPDTVGHLIQHRLTLSGISAPAQSR